VTNYIFVYIFLQHENYALLLHEGIALTSLIQAVPYEHCKQMRDFSVLMETKFKKEYSRMMEQTFQNYKKLRFWITRYYVRLDNLTKSMFPLIDD
jgi:hypothetical protein